jgi:hypothetical protein
LGKKLGWFVFVKGYGGCGSPEGHSGGWGAGGVGFPSKLAYIGGLGYKEHISGAVLLSIGESHGYIQEGWRFALLQVRPVWC